VCSSDLGDCISPGAVLDILKSGYEGFPKAKKIVKFCGELSVRTEFANELANLGVKSGMEIQPWKQLSKFSLEKNADFSKLSQCMGAIGATLSCA
jgi:phosphoenolpyruvate-protein kinase (PTS system EI component)